MSDSDKAKRARPSAPQPGVLGSLPSHRPQRVTARRLSTRQNTANGSAPKRTKPPAPTSSERPRSRRSQAVKPAPSPKKPSPQIPSPQIPSPRAPRQGFESEEIPKGTSIDPPSATQLVGSALELAASIAQGTMTRGGRLLLGALERLPRV